MKVALALLLLGLVLVGYSTTLAPYKNEAEYQARYSQMTKRDSDRFYALRDEQLTPKFEMQDYGVTSIFLALMVWILSRGKSVTAPKSLFVFITLSVAIPCVQVGALLFDLFQGASRGEFPHWADSLGIPLMGVPILFGGALLWILLHVAFFLANVKYCPAPLRLAISLQSNLWLLLLSLITAVLVVLSIAEGAYWYAIPGALWLYLYLSLAAIRRSAGAGVRAE